MIRYTWGMHQYLPWWAPADGGPLAKGRLRTQGETDGR